MAKRTNRGPVLKVRQGDDISAVIVPIALSQGRYASSAATNYALRLLVSKLQGVMHRHLAANADNQPLDDGQIMMAFEEEGFEVAPATTQFVNKGEYLYTVSLKDLGLDRQHYAEFFDAIVRAGEYRIEYEGDDPELGHGLTWYNLYRPILWNYKQESYTDKKGNVSTRYVSTQGPKITIAIEPRAAQTIYNPARHGQSIDTTGLKLHTYTERILNLFAPYWRRYTHIEIDWIALRLQMQLDEDITPRNLKKLEIVQEIRDDNPKTGKRRGVYILTAPNTVIRQTEKETTGPNKGKPKKGGYRRTYESWSEFKREILDPTHSDVEGMAATGRAFYTFTADVVKQSIPGKSNRPVPVRVIFDLTLTRTGQSYIDDTAQKSALIELENLIVAELAIPRNRLSPIIHAESVGPATYQALRDKIHELAERRRADGFKLDSLADLRKAQAALAADPDSALAQATIRRLESKYRRDLTNYLFTALRNYVKNELGFAPSEEIGPSPVLPVGARDGEVKSEKSSNPSPFTLNPSPFTLNQNSPSAQPAPSITGGMSAGQGGSGKWPLTPSDRQALQAMVAALRSQLAPAEWQHWVQPIAAADTVDCRTLLVTYYGSGYGRQNPRQAPAFLAALAALRRTFPDRIDDIRVAHE